MKKLLFASFAVASLAACSTDEEVLRRDDSADNLIRFGVTAERNTRAADVFCNNNLPGSFFVSASHEGKLYMLNDEILKDNGAWANSTGDRYWPNVGEVTFYAHVNGEDYFKWDEVTQAPKFVDFVVNSNVMTYSEDRDVPGEDGNSTTQTVEVPGQVDLLYAVKKQSKSEGQKVNLNFRHALSQIVFKAKNESKGLHIAIEGVSIVNVQGKGTYTFPTDDTDTYSTAHPNNPDGENVSRGDWALIENVTSREQLTEYSVSFDEVDVVGEVDLTAANDDGKEYSGKAMLLIPQKTTKVDVNSGIKQKTGSYFLVKCKIWNVASADGGVDKDNDIVLWQSKEGEAANILLPVDFDWKEGKKYTYTFVFGKGNGGYNPEPDPDPEDPDPDPDPVPDPVLVPITFSVSVDEFLDGGNTDITTEVEDNNNNSGNGGNGNSGETGGETGGE